MARPDLPYMHLPYMHDVSASMEVVVAAGICLDAA